MKNVKVSEGKAGDWNFISFERDQSAPAASSWTNPMVAQFLVDIFDESDERPAREQANDRYAHGGGWRPNANFEVVISGHEITLRFPGDPPFRELSRCQLRDELIILFDYGYVAIIQKDGSYEVCRMD